MATCWRASDSHASAMAIGVIVDTEERRTKLGHQSWVRARFGDFITPWIEEWQLEPVS
jgi:hypothetical protein